MPEDQFKYLFQKFSENKCSKEELQKFYTLLKDKGDNDAFELMDEYYSRIAPNSNSEKIDWNYMFQQITRKKIESAKRIGWRRIIAAASVIIVLGLGAYFLINNKRPEQPPAVARYNDVEAPKDSRAVITLADGRKVYLDSAETGTLATQANITVERSADGKIVYQPTNGIAKEIVYNTLSNPRGSRVIDMQLSDGSHVWLNAGSSIKYPVAFIGNERKVEITGEAYFEVAHDAAHPFFVGKGDVTVQVLGTHFNVNAYDDEPNLKVTLLEGSVKIGNGISNATIKPGQQAQVSSGVKVVNDADLDEVMAWKNGEFQFGDKSDIGSVMREISRWYDVDVEVKGDINGHIGGSISRTVNVSRVLQMLEATGMIHYKVEGKRVTITP